MKRKSKTTKKAGAKKEVALPISKNKFNIVFEKSTPELKDIGKAILEFSSDLRESRFSATTKAITFSTEVAFGFMRSNSRCVELNVFVPLDYDLGPKWKESRQSTTKKLGTLRIVSNDDFNETLRDILVEAHRISSKPRVVNLETKEGFFASLKALRS